VGNPFIEVQIIDEHMNETPLQNSTIEVAACFKKSDSLETSSIKNIQPRINQKMLVDEELSSDSDHSVTNDNGKNIRNYVLSSDSEQSEKNQNKINHKANTETEYELSYDSDQTETQITKTKYNKIFLTQSNYLQTNTPIKNLSTIDKPNKSTK